MEEVSHLSIHDVINVKETMQCRFDQIKRNWMSPLFPIITPISRLG
jgi:hypothetical protein